MAPKNVLPKVVEDVLANWKDMEGDTDQEKRLNAALTDHFVFPEAPADECLGLARTVMTLVASHPAGWEYLVENLFRQQFAVGYKGTDVTAELLHGGPPARGHPLPSQYPACKAGVQVVKEVLCG